MEKKYELVKDNVKISIINGRVLILYRIRALKDFSDVKKGDLGGFVEKEENLGQYGNCWLYSDAKVYDDAEVHGNACVSGNACVFGTAQVSGNVQVSDNARVSGNASVSGNAIIADNAIICEHAKVYCNAKIYGNTIVCGYASISTNADIESSDKYYVSKLHMDDTTYATFYKSGTGNILVSYGFYNEPIIIFEKMINSICDNNEMYIFQAKTVIDFAKRQLLDNTNIFNSINPIRINNYTSDDVSKEVEKMNIKSGYRMPNGKSMNIIQNISIKKGCSDDKLTPINHCPYNTSLDFDGDVVHKNGMLYYDTDDALASFAASNSERKKLITNSIYGIFKKYELLKDRDYTINFDGRTLYRIRALRDFGDVKKGDLGGFVEKEDNLSHNGNCWIYGNAKVFGNARVFGDAWVFGDAKVSGNAQVSGNAKVFGNARVSGDAWVFGDAKVSDNAWISGDDEVICSAKVSGSAEVHESARVSGNAQIYGNARISGKADVSDNAWVSDNACVSGGANIYSNSVVHGDVTINGDTSIGIDGYIKNKNDYYNVPYTTDDGITRTMTIYKTKSDNMMVSILDIFNCSVERLISNGINYKTTKSDKPKLEYHDKVGDDDVIVYKDENNIMMVKSKLFSGSFDVFRRIIFDTTNTIYGAKSQYISNTETIKTMFKYREVLKKALKYFKDNDN